MGLELARYIVEAVEVEGRSYREVARAHGVSKSWVGKVVSRFREGGYEAIKPRSRAPHRVPHRTSAAVEDQIVVLRKQLAEAGFDSGAATIHHHLEQKGGKVPSVSTIWRVLRRRGFVVPQPHKRPRSSWIRFQASLPNECWQSDVTHWRLGDGTEVEICSFLDDHSRLLLACRVAVVTTVRQVVATFRGAANRYGLPASVLTDNGCVYTAWHRGGATAFEVELLSLGIVLKHSRPGHPQTCGKIERFHQTLKLFLAKQPPPATVDDLQAQINRFTRYYNQVRPHRALNRNTPREAFDGRDKARPANPQLPPGKGIRVRQDRVDKEGKLTLRHAGRLHHIGVGRDHRGKRVLMLIAGLDIRILTRQGELLRQLTLDPAKDYQPTGRPSGPPKGRPLQPRDTPPPTMP
jgi:transposase InsO family protein